VKLGEEYEVSFNANGGSGTIGSVYTFECGTVVLPANTLTKTDYIFRGWAISQDEADSGVVTYANSATFTNSGNVDTILYAVWQKDIQYTITYHGNNNTGGNAPTDNNSPYYEGSKVTILDRNTLSRNNYVFSGWSSSPIPGGALYLIGSQVTISENMDLYAIWNENPKFNITYYGNENTGGIAPVDSSSPYYVGSNITILSKGSLTKTNYTFVEWNTSADGSGDKYKEGSTLIFNDELELYAIWKENAKHTITYHGNENTGGSAPTDSNSPYYVGSTITTLPAGTLVRSNYTFMGWNTKDDGSGTNYAAGASLTLSGNIDLYAKWQENAKHTVTYHGNENTGGNAPTDNNSPYYVGSSITTLPAGTLVKNNYTFMGWNTEANGSGTNYAVGASLTLSGNIDLYAKWQENAKYKITYNGNENTAGSAPSDDNSPYYDGSTIKALSAGSLVKDNYSFIGWNTKSDGKGNNYAANDFIVISSNLDLYAMWLENGKYAVTYYGNENTGGSSPIDETSPYYSNTSVSVLGQDTLVRENYTFDGWNTQADGKGTKYNALDSFMITGNVSLYAMWKENAKHKVTYHGNNNTGGDVPVDGNSPYYVGSTISLLPAGSLVRANYTFEGWNTQADGQGTDYLSGATLTLNNDVNLYAKWKENNKYKIRYDGNLSTSGEVPVDNTQYYVNSTVSVLGKNTLERTNYTFIGWNTQ
ncbi:MAG: InlB B-repeat-containing protein, partial [Bacilli bacterium]